MLLVCYFIELHLQFEFRKRKLSTQTIYTHETLYLNFASTVHTCLNTCDTYAYVQIRQPGIASELRTFESFFFLHFLTRLLKSMPGKRLLILYEDAGAAVLDVLVAVGEGDGSHDAATAAGDEGSSIDQI